MFMFTHNEIFSYVDSICPAIDRWMVDGFYVIKKKYVYLKKREKIGYILSRKKKSLLYNWKEMTKLEIYQKLYNNDNL